jgi:hypothetical protein
MNGYKNTLLNAMDGDIIARLRLKPVKFELKHEFEYPGNPIDHLYFLEEGMVSMLSLPIPTANRSGNPAAT